MKTTKENLLKIWGALESFSKTNTQTGQPEQLLKTRFSYNVIKNKKLISNEVEALQEAMLPSKEYQEFEKERLETCVRLGDKDPLGNPKVNRLKQFVFTENKEEMDKLINEMLEKYKDAIDGFNKQEEELGEILKEEIEIEVYLIDLSLFPEETPIETLEALDYLIKEEE